MKLVRTIAIALLVAMTAGQALAAGSIPAGTVITRQNWQQYKDFMPLTLQMMFQSNNRAVEVPPEAQMVVADEHNYPISKGFLDATEKYSKQVRLVKAPNGSYGIQGYVAGVPFPDLKTSDPLAGYKLMYDFYYQYSAAAYAFDHSQVIDIDQYDNESFLHALLIQYQLMHVTDTGYAMTNPAAAGDGVLITTMAEQLDPEQIRYLTALNITWDDPNRFPEAYVFIPSLRRVLRLSSAARCAPFQGQDFANDDLTNIPQPPTWFQAKYLGKRKMVDFFFNDDPKSLAASAQRANYYKGSAALFPVPSMGSWQTRDEYVLQLQRLPQYARGYCYANRVMYLDAQTYTWKGWGDLWDQNNKFWRGVIGFEAPLKKPDGSYWPSAMIWAHDNPDFQSNHQSLLMPPTNGMQAAYLNQNVPQQWNNYHRWGTPSGLQEVMQ
jgi:hypothetical protein